MDDRELLELAAKAAGLHLSWGPKGCWPYLRPAHCNVRQAAWNPLEDDGDALRLAVKLRMETYHGWDEGHAVYAIASPEGLDGICGVYCVEQHKGDPCAATRRAIVRAAAEIGRSMP